MKKNRRTQIINSLRNNLTVPGNPRALCKRACVRYIQPSIKNMIISSGQKKFQIMQKRKNVHMSILTNTSMVFHKIITFDILKSNISKFNNDMTSFFGHCNCKYYRFVYKVLLKIKLFVVSKTSINCITNCIKGNNTTYKISCCFAKITWLQF